MNKKSYTPLQVWFLACRPKTLAASIIPVIVGTSMAAKYHNISLLDFFVTLLTAILIQIGTNLANDYFDFKKGADNDERIGPLRVTQAGLVTSEQIKFAMQTVFLVAALLGLYLVYIGGLPIFIIGALSLCFAVLYTGGPFPFAYYGLGDIFVFVFFGPTAVCGTYYILTSSFSFDAFFAGCSIGFLSTAILVVNNLRDIETDTKSGKKTLAVRIGSLATKIEWTTLLFAAFLLPVFMFVFTKANSGVMLSSLTLFPAYSVLRTVLFEQDKRKLNQALANTGMLLTIYGILFSIGWNLSM